MKKKIMIEGMSCGHCVAHVKEALKVFAQGEIEVSLEGKYALVDTEADNEVIVEAIDEAGYDVIEIGEI